MPGQVVVRQKIGDRIAWHNTWTEIIDAVGFVGVVLVPTGVRTGGDHFVQIEDQPLRGLKACKSLAGLFWNQRNAITGVDVYISVQTWIPGQRAVARVACRTVDNRIALVGGFKKGPVEAPGDSPKTAAEVRIEPFTACPGKVLKVPGSQFHRRDE